MSCVIYYLGSLCAVYAARRSYSKCKSYLSLKLLFLTMIATIILTISREETKEKTYHNVRTISQLIVRCICSIIDVFIMFTKLTLKIVGDTKIRLNELLEAAIENCVSAHPILKYAHDDEKERKIKLKQSIHDLRQSLKKSLVREENEELLFTKVEEQLDLVREILRTSKTKPIPNFVLNLQISVLFNDKDTTHQKLESIVKVVSDGSIAKVHVITAEDGLKKKEKLEPEQSPREEIDVPKFYLVEELGKNKTTEPIVEQEAILRNNFSKDETKHNLVDKIQSK